MHLNVNVFFFYRIINFFPEYNDRFPSYRCRTMHRLTRQVVASSSAKVRINGKLFTFSTFYRLSFSCVPSFPIRHSYSITWFLLLSLSFSLSLFSLLNTQTPFHIVWNKMMITIVFYMVIYVKFKSSSALHVEAFVFLFTKFYHFHDDPVK